MKRIAIIISTLFCGLLFTTTASAVTIGSVNSYTEREEFYNMINVSRNAPTNTTDAGDEYISTFNGGVCYEKTDLSLPGKGGLDLNIRRSFNTAQNTDENGVSKRYMVQRSGEGDSLKYAFRYYPNGNTAAEPLYIVYETIYDMFEAENGSGSIYLSDDYSQSLTNLFSVKYWDVDTGQRFYYWGIGETSGNGLNLHSDVLMYEHAQEGSLEFKRDLTVGSAEVYCTSLHSYEYVLRQRRNSSYYIGGGWEYCLPTLQNVDPEIVGQSSSDYTWNITGVFYDPEWNYALDIFCKYRTNHRYKNFVRLGSYLYNPTSSSTIQKSSMYSVKYIMYSDENETDEIDRIIITRIDGKQFEFTNYDCLSAIRDADGNEILCEDTARQITMTDTLNRTVVLSKTGINVNGEDVVTYEKTVINDDDADPNELFEEDNLYEFTVKYKINDVKNKTICYKVSPHGKKVILAEREGDGAHQNSERQTVDTDKLLLDSIRLDTGASINYNYGIVNRRDIMGNKRIPTEDYYVTKRYFLKNDSNVQENIVSYTHNDNERVSETVYNNDARFKITDSYSDYGYLCSRVIHDTENDFIKTEEYEQTQMREGNYKPSEKTVTIQNGENTVSTTELYAYAVTNQKISQITRDDIVIYTASYSGNIPYLEKYKTAENAWNGIKNTVENNRITSSVYSAYTDTDTSGTSETITYNYNSNGDLIKKVAAGVTTEYTYNYTDYSQAPASQYSLIVESKIGSVPNSVNNNGEIVTQDIITSLKFDNFGREIEQTDGNGNTVTTSYDGLGRPLVTTYPNLSTVEISYDDENNIITEKNQLGRIDQYVFDSLGRNISGSYRAAEQLPLTSLFTKSYDNAGRLTTAVIYNTGVQAAKAAYTYYADGSLKKETAIELPSNNILAERSYAYNDVTDDGSFCNTTTVKQNSSSNTDFKEYRNIYGNILKETIGQAGTNVEKSTEYTTDLQGNILTMQGYKASAGAETYTYDYRNRVVKKQDSKGSLEYTYSNGNLYKEKDRNGNSTTYTYNTNGSLFMESKPFNTSDSITKNYYDASGNICRVEEQISSNNYRVTEYRYDNMNNLVAVITHPTDDSSEIVKYIYDAAGNVTSMITGLSSLSETVNPALHSITKYTYDTAGNLLTETDPLANTRTIVYNNLGLPVSETDKNGVTSQYSYDALLRIASISKGSEEVSYSYDMAGNLTQMQDNEGTTDYTYDYCGNQLSQSRGGTILSYTYDDIGNCITMSSSANNGASTQSATYRYSIKGNLTQAEHGLFKGVYVYDDNGNLKRSTVYYSTSSVNIEMYTYNAGNLPVKRTRGRQTTNIYYNLDGSISRINGGGENSEFVYDKAGRLITEEKDGETTTYTYDKRGNRLSKTNADESITYVYDLNNRLISSTKVIGDSTETTTYTYDANGNLIQKQSPNESITYSYNPMGTLASVANNTTQTTAYYTYDGNGLRQSKRVVTAPDDDVTTQFVNDRGNVIEEITDGVSTKYSRGRRILGVKDGTTNAYYLYNMHGDVESVIRKTNSYVLDKYDYDAFGNCSAEYARMNYPFRYCGEYQDLCSGLIYLRNRYYDPSIGRFITEDPARDGLNWYVYCGNNPIKYVDPTGLFRIIDGKSYDKYQVGSGNINNQVNDYVSEDIKKMQIKLQELGYLDKSITWYGYFGNQTLAAVNAFKEANNIQNNTKETRGIVGATTWALMGLDFDVIESVGLTSSNVSMGRGVLRVDRNIVNANMVNTYYAAGAIKDAYKVAFGEDFNVTTDSVYWELVGHIFADEVAEANKGGMLDPFWKRVQRSTGTIDIGDNVIVPDNNRRLWDWISQLGSK